ncbi:MAG: agmatine deiminase family protein [Pseudomonadota bacterium]
MTSAPVRTRWRLPAEWEAQDAVLLAWPFEGSDWDPVLRYARKACADIITETRRHQPVILLIRPDELLTDGCWEDTGGDHAVQVVAIDYDDTWVRDTGPLSVVSEGGSVAWVDFAFDGWGGRYHRPLDATLAERLWREPLFSHLAREAPPHVLEGGALDSDGQGLLLTSSRTWACRATDFSRAATEEMLRLELGVERVLWLDHGELLGDETDGHIDMLARFAPDHTIVYQGCQDVQDPHYPFLTAMARQLESFRTLDGSRFRLLALPLPDALGKGRFRCPATYANFLVLNDAVLVPSYGDADNDARAADIIGAAFPGRDIRSVDCRVLITQGGALHCSSMQLPRGTLRP